MFRLKFLFKKEKDDPYSKKKPTSEREFYLPEGKSYEYLPRERYTFSSNRLLIYESKSFNLKFLYLPKLLLPIIGVTTMAVSNALLDYTLMITGVIYTSAILGIGHSLLGCRVASKVYLHEDGKNIDVHTRILNLVTTVKTHPIKEFQQNYSSLLMFMWNLNPIPKNLIAGIEAPFEELGPMYARRKFGFYLLHGKPREVKEDLLINVLNGVSINTKAAKARVNFFKERYKEISE